MPTHPATVLPDFVDDPHGLVDSFLYGVSLSRIAYEVPDAGQLFVMPSGTEPPDDSSMTGSAA